MPTGKEFTVPTITPHLWFDSEAVEAAEFYTSTLPDSRVTSTYTLLDTPSGDCDVVSFELCGQPFIAISAGPLFKFTPSISFAVACETTQEVDDLWTKLSAGGKALMQLGSYPFSQRYGWCEDRYGLSWQIMHSTEISQRITPTLLFVGDVCGKAEQAIELYTSVFPDSKVGLIDRYGAGEEPDEEGTIRYAAFTLDGQEFAAMDSGREHGYNFTEAISLMVNCESQHEIDHYWERIPHAPESEQCGWIKDPFGVSWQITPTALGDLLERGTEAQTAAVTQAFLDMKKFDIEALEKTYEVAGGKA